MDIQPIGQNKCHKKTKACTECLESNKTVWLKEFIDPIHKNGTLS